MKFLKKDPRSGKLWADHHDLQIVANVYGIRIHILTVGIVSRNGPKARWTHLDPDGRLGSFDANASKMYGGDMWILHQDSTHFDLIIKKDSILAKKDGIFHKTEENLISDESDPKEKVQQSKEIGPGYMGWAMKEDEEKNTPEEKHEELRTAYQMLKETVRMMDNKFEELKKDKVDTIKEFNKLKNDIKSLKDDYKDCMEAL